MTGAPERLFVKLCGFVEPEDVAAASALDVDALGFVLADDARVALDVGRLGELFAAATHPLTRVAVVGPRSRDDCRRILELGFDAVQVVLTDWWQSTLDGKAVIPVLFDGPDVGARLSDYSRRFAADLRAPRTGAHGQGLLCVDGPHGGGRGARADRERAREVARTWPLLLAGGLRADNVGEAIADVRPRGVDVSSGVEAASGRKDPAKMAAFVAAVRAAERELC